LVNKKPINFDFFEKNITPRIDFLLDEITYFIYIATLIVIGRIK